MTLTSEKPALIAAQQKGEAHDPPEFHWTVEAFYKVAEAGSFGHDARLELIHGRIIENIGQNPPHSSLASIIADMLRAAFPADQYAVREEKPIHIAFDGEPTPDVFIALGKQNNYRKHHPSPQEVVLSVEVSDTTVLYDLGGKSLLYAEAGIEDYWVVLVNDGAIVQHRPPSPEGYQSVVRLSGADAILPLAAPEVVWTVNALLGIEELERV